MTQKTSLFDRIRWRDPLTGRALEPIVLARTPAGVPLAGALRIEGTNSGYPIVDCIARMTPEMAAKHAAWLEPMGLTAPPLSLAPGKTFQEEVTVDSFGFQWSWNAAPRDEADLKHRVAEKFHFTPDGFRGKLAIDAGAGAGDQTGYMLAHGAQVVSIDLSAAIEVVGQKHRLNPNWFGVQGDITNLPFAEDQFEIVYCEGVIQHTRDSYATVCELRRITAPGGRVHAAHYILPAPPPGAIRRLRRRMATGFVNTVRGRFSRMNRYKLLLLTGVLSAISYVPILGWFLRRSGLVLQSPYTPDLLMTWTSTYDIWGGHAYQRYLTPEEFQALFEKAGSMELVERDAGSVVARRVA